MNCLVAHLCLALCDPLDCSTPASLSITNSWSLLKLMSIASVLPSNHLVLCRPLLLLPSMFPSFKVFSNESALRVRWPKYWSFSFSISPSNDYSGLISFRIGWFDLLVVQESSPAPQFKSINSPVLCLLYGPNITSIHDYWKNHSLEYKNLYHKVMFLLFNMLFRFVIAFLRRSKSVLISWQGLLISCHLNKLQGLPWWLRG